MFEICETCGAKCADGEVDEAASTIACGHCGHRQFLRRLPCFIVTGASGTGKSTLARAMALRHDRPDAVYLDSDMLLVRGLTEDGWPAYRNSWLRVCANIQQSGRPVVLFGSSSLEDFENASRRRFFASIHYLALVCSDEALERRLKARPSWRQSARESFLTAQLAWNRAFREKTAEPAIPYRTFDTTVSTLDETCRAIGSWIAERI